MKTAASLVILALLGMQPAVGRAQPALEVTHSQNTRTVPRYDVFEITFGVGFRA